MPPGASAQQHARSSRCAQQFVVWRHRPRAAGHVGQRHARDALVLQRHHAPEAPRGHQLGRVHAVARGEHAVVGGGRAAALHVAEQRAAHLAADERLQALLKQLTDAAQARLRIRVCCRRSRLVHLPHRLRGVERHAFGDADEQALALLEQIPDTEQLRGWLAEALAGQAS